MLPDPASVKEIWPQIYATVAVSVALFGTGFHTGWPAPSIPKLISDEFPANISNDEASYIVLISPLGNLCGGLVGSLFLDAVGRRKTILFTVPLQITALILIAISYYLMELLYVARYIGGLSEGLAFIIIPIYVAEISTPKVRGVLGTVLVISTLSGTVYVNVVGSYCSISATALSGLVFPILFLLLFWKMADTPYFLLMKNQQDEAEKALKFFRTKQNVRDELNSLIKDVNRQMSESGTYKDIFVIESNRKAFFLILGIRFIQQCTGISPFLVYIQLHLSQATSALKPHIGATIFLSLQLLLAIFSTTLVDKWGRKPLLLFSVATCGLNLTIQTLYFALRDYTEIDVSSFDWLPLLLMLFYVASFSMGLGLVPSIMTSEIFSASIKGKCLCLVNLVFITMVMVSIKFYQVTADNFGLLIPYVTFAVATFLGVVFIKYVVPETKGKTLEEIQQVLKNRKNLTNTKV